MNLHQKVELYLNQLAAYKCYVKSLESQVLLLKHGHDATIFDVLVASAKADVDALETPIKSESKQLIIQ